MKKIRIIVMMICMSAVMICMAAGIKARADEIAASAPEILALTDGIELTGISKAYNELSGEKKLIANYLLGAFNYIYLTARGFRFQIAQNDTAFSAQYAAVGETIWQYCTTAYGWKSRVNETFRQYLSSIIVYANSQTQTFAQWFDSIRQGGANQLLIPYSKEAFDAWTEWYNDPSADGIISFGSLVSSWDSGNQYDFAFTGIPWDSNTHRDRYNDFILNYSPVMYTNSGMTAPDPYYGQFVVSFKDVDPVDSLFVLRTTYNKARFGYSDMRTDPMHLYYMFYGYTQPGNYLYSQYMQDTYSDGIFDTNTNNLQNAIDFAFNRTPEAFQISQGITFIPTYWYPLIQHVYLVDDLNTLSNPEEVFNVHDFDIVDQKGLPDYIITPNGKFFSPAFPLADPSLDLPDISFDIDLEPTSDGDFHTDIVNNTTINNYYVTNDDRINVPVEWFENDLSDQLANDSIPFLQFARDCIDCLGDLQIYFYGALVFGLGGGVLKKFLL